jgi:15,16-dihydrobiliverdin:ferredoxin oxidoreductase
MDTEGPMFPFTKPIPTSFWNKQPLQQQQQKKVPAYHGMPWTSSLATTEAADDCVYMPFWEWQLDTFQTQLSNFQIHPLANSTWEYVCNEEKQTRMVTLVASSDEYRQIRMTYLDGGDKTQIFTSVCYPRGNLPILGIDLLQFGKQGVVICDFQPIHATESEHDLTYEHLLRPIRDAFPSLQQPMSNRFFDPNQYFSSQTLLGRRNSATTSSPQNRPLWQDLWPAYQAYVQTHVQLTQQQKPKPSSDDDEDDAMMILERHAAYDTYVASHDPAHPFHSAMFGAEFSKDYLYKVMFPLANQEEPAVEEEEETA